MAKSILLIEDDQFIRELYERELQKEGYTVVASETAEDAEVFVKNQKFDLILVDIMLPGKSGLDFLKEQHDKGATKTSKYFLLSNIGQETVVKEGFKLGAKGYLMKSSYSPSEIVREIGNILETGN